MIPNHVPPPELPEINRAGSTISRSSTTRALMGTATPLLKNLPLEDNILGYNASRPKGVTPLPADILSRPLKIGKNGTVHPFLYGKKALRSIKEDSPYFDVWPANAQGVTPESMSDPHDMGAKPQLLLRIEQHVHTQLAALAAKHTTDVIQMHDERWVVFREALQMLADGFRTYRGVIQVVLVEFDTYIEHMKKLLASKDVNCRSQKIGLEQQVEVLEQEKRVVMAEVEMRRNDVKAMESQVADVREMYAKRAHEIDDLESQLRRLHKERQESEEVQTNLMKRIQRLEKDVFLAKKALENPLQEMEKMAEKVSATEERLRDLIMLQEDTVKENQRLNLALQESQKATAEAKLSVKASSSAINNQLTAAKRKIAVMQKEVDARTPRPEWSGYPIEFGERKTSAQRVQYIFDLYSGVTDPLSPLKS